MKQYSFLKENKMMTLDHVIDSKKAPELLNKLRIKVAKQRLKNPNNNRFKKILRRIDDAETLVRLNPHT